MTRACEICGRGPAFGKSRSHSNIASRRRFNINLQTKTVEGARLRICARCIKTMKKTTKK